MTPSECVTERPLQFGAEGQLVGVLTTPRGGAARAAAPAVIFLNAGVIHRVGPHRLHVNLARRLAADGITSLRMDFSGIGDSRPVPGGPSFPDSAVADVRTAMDWLGTEAGFNRFVLFGLCSGADSALAAGVDDPRVEGLVLLDPPAYVTVWSRLRKIRNKLGSVGSAREVAASAARLVRRYVHPPSPNDFVGARDMPPAPVFRAQLRALVDRGVSILAVFSGDLDDHFNDEDQLFELFPEFRGRIDCVYFPRANHVFSLIDMQAALTRAVTAWMGARGRKTGP